MNNVNESLRAAIQQRLDNLTKPPGSLGMLEDIVLQYCLCKGRPDAPLEKTALRVFAADHGITAEGVSPYPSAVTVQMVANMVHGGAAVTVMCQVAGVEYRIVDMGVASDIPPHARLISCKIARGSRNFRLGFAMTPDECSAAVNAGRRIASELDCDIAAVGEMGIGNTSSASALIALLLGLDGAETVGRGTGAEGTLLEHKRAVVHDAVEYHRQGWDGSAMEALARVGGLEIAGMVGFMLECTKRRIPVVVDGFIATAAALVALSHEPRIRDYLFWGHVSDERFHERLLTTIGARPILRLGMRLGEGTGAVLALQIIEQALACYHRMATFAQAGVSNRDR